MRPRLLIVLPLTVMVGGLTWWMIHRQTATSEAVQISTDLSSAAQQPPESVAALGQLEPAGEIRRLAAPTVGVVGAPRIAKLYVDEGDAISAGQELAEFDNRDGLLADLEEVDARLRSLEAQITLQKRELSRYSSPAASGAVSMVKVEEEQDELIRLESQRLQAQAQRKGLVVDLAKTRLRSPMDGLVLKLHARVGERPDAEGVMEVGASQNMQARIEVYESDISRVRLDQVVILTSENGGFKGDLEGRVVRISPQVQQREVLSTDPTGDADARVVEVEVALDPADADRVARLSGLKVIARFQP